MQLFIIDNLPIFTYHIRQAEKAYKDFLQGKYIIETILYRGKVYKGIKI